SIVIIAYLRVFFFFCTATPTPEIYTLSLHDALPISFPGIAEVTPSSIQGVHIRRNPDRWSRRHIQARVRAQPLEHPEDHGGDVRDRKSTRLNSSHLGISYAVFCLKKKKKKTNIHLHR